jgi:hypothetical protein
VVDNVPFHKVAGVEEAIQAVGASLRYLPKYSPDLNPIELLFHPLQTFLRKAASDDWPFRRQNFQPSFPSSDRRCEAASARADDEHVEFVCLRHNPCPRLMIAMAKTFATAMGRQQANFLPPCHPYAGSFQTERLLRVKTRTPLLRPGLSTST